MSLSFLRGFLRGLLLRLLLSLAETSVLPCYHAAFDYREYSEHCQRYASDEHDGAVGGGFAGTLKIDEHGGAEEEERHDVQPWGQSGRSGTEEEKAELEQGRERQQDSEHERYQGNECLLEQEHAQAQHDGGGAGYPAYCRADGSEA